MKASLQVLALAGSETWRSVSEVDFQRAVTEYAKSQNWSVMSFRKSAIPGKDGRWRGLADPGWPDLILIRGERRSEGRMLAVELKSETGTVTQAQRKWLRLLHAVGAEAMIVRPRDAAELMEVLT